VPRGLRSYYCGMAPSTYQYHWLFSPTIIINPHTYTEYTADILLPPGHTLRRILLNQPLFYWKRGSVSSDDQQMYFVELSVKYGNAEGAPFLYRSTRLMKAFYTVDASGVTNVYTGFHSGAELELGFNEKVQRGGFYSGEVPLRLSWFIGSSGHGDEELSGQANTPFRALYSKLVTP
jgi:hypothetical protein